MKFQGKTHHHFNPQVRDLAQNLMVHVEKGTYRSAADLESRRLKKAIAMAKPLVALR